MVGHLDKERHKNQKGSSKSVSPCVMIFFNLLLLFSIQLLDLQKETYIYIKGGNRKLYIILTSLSWLLCSSFLVTCCCWLYWVFYTVSVLFYFHIVFYFWLYNFLVWICCCLSQCVACCIKSWKLKWCDWSYSRDVSSFQ